MDRAWLQSELAAGRSIEAIARAAGREPSTVAYWVNKHGLVSLHAAKHAARGGIPRELLEELVEAGLSIRAIAERVGMSYATVQHWLKRHGLKTRRASQPRSSEARTIMRECAVHGLTAFVKYGRRTITAASGAARSGWWSAGARSRRCWSRRRAAAARCADTTVMSARSSSTISIRRPSLSASGCAA